MTVRRTLIVSGVTLAVAACAWPWLRRLPLGRLPGDVLVERPGLRLDLPLTNCLLVSLVLSLIVYFARNR